MALEREFTFRNTSLPQCSYNVFVDMRDNKKFCDIELKSGTQHISAHRVILAAGMPLFRETFSNEGEILVPNVDPTVFELLIDYVYSCELKITMDNVRELLSGSSALQMYDVQDACCDFLSQRLHPQNVLSFRDLTKDFNLSKLKKYVDHYVKENFEEVSRTEEFLNCPSEYLRELIAKDDLNVVSEEKVLDSVLRWVKASVDERKGELPVLLAQVRMALLEPLYLTELVEKEELIRKSYICRDLVDEARNYTLFPEKRRKSCSFSTKSREFMKISGAQETDAKLYCLKSKLKYTVEQYHLINETWKTKSIKKFIINYNSTVELNRKIYFLHDSYLLKYDPEDDEFKSLRPFAEWRRFTAAVSLRNKMFVCGGLTSSSVASNAVECYDPDKDEVKQVHALQKARYALNAASLGDYIYALGGMDNDNVYDIVERYSFVLDKWLYVSPMLTPRCNAGASVLNGKIYICGGYKDPLLTKCMETAEMYDPLTNKWQLISSMNTARAELILLAFAGKLYATCGFDDDLNLLDSCQVYDLETDKWDYDTTFGDFGEVSGAIVL